MPRKTGFRRALLAAAMLMQAVTVAHAQNQTEAPADQNVRLARRAAGIRVGTWHVETPPSTNGTRYKATFMFEGYVQRALDRHVALETSVALWRRNSTRPQQGSIVTTKSYIIPIVTGLKFYPFTLPRNTFEPFMIFGAGFVIGGDVVSANAIGGGGNTTSTGFALKAGTGVEYHATRKLGIALGGRYEWMNFGGRVSDQQSFGGKGLEAALTVRLPL